MKLQLSMQEAEMLRKILERNIGDMAVMIRHTRGYDAKEDLKMKRRVMRRVMEKLSPVEQSQHAMFQQTAGQNWTIGAK